MQRGGGNCTLCGSPGTNKSSCPWNEDATTSNYGKHPLAQGLRPKNPQAGAGITCTSSLSRDDDVVNLEGRISAGAYYREHGPGCVGDVCDIRGNKELKCLLIRSTGIPYWAAYSVNSDKQASCGKTPWIPKCKYKANNSFSSAFFSLI